MADDNESSLFGFGSEWACNAYLGKYDDRRAAYADGFGCAVEVLVRHVRDTTSNLDILVFPIVFSARQSVELRLKHLHEDCCELLNLKYKLPAHHDIAKLWQMIRPLLDEIVEGEAVGDYQSVECFLLEFAKVDRGSFAFRYPSSIEGEQSIDPTISYINVGEFYDKFSRAVRNIDSFHLAVGSRFQER